MEQVTGILNLIAVYHIAFIYNLLFLNLFTKSSGSKRDGPKIMYLKMILSRSNLWTNILCRRIRNMSCDKKLILYGDEASPPVRFALITASALKVDLDFQKIDLFKKENRTEFYKQINPLQKVPALSVDGTMLCDSHAITLYLCRTTKNTLYPEEAMLRSRIDEMMYFNSGVLFPIDSAIFTDFFAGKWPVNETILNKWYSALDYLESKLNDQLFLTGDEVRLCDYCCGTTVSSLEILIPLKKRHSKIKEWLENLKASPYFEINERGINRLQSFVNALRSH